MTPKRRGLIAALAGTLASAVVGFATAQAQPALYNPENPDPHLPGPGPHLPGPGEGRVLPPGQVAQVPLVPPPGHWDQPRKWAR